MATANYHPLTPGQEAGLQKFMQFYVDPTQTVMVLKGYSGTGKSTLVKSILRDLPKMAEMCRAIAPGWREPEPVLTATTNQAAEAFHISVDRVLPAQTIHSFLSLRLHTPDYRKPKETVLVPYGDPVEHKLIFIDESSYIGRELLKLILTQVYNCKIVFIGDYAQLTPIDDDIMPAFEMNAMEIELTDLVRFEPGPMTDIVTDLRGAVLGHGWKKFKRTPGIIDHLPRKEFGKLALDMFKKPDEHPNMKILAYSNNRVTLYNNGLSKHILGTSNPMIGQKMMVNAAVRNNASSCFNNEEVQIGHIEEAYEYGCDGWEIELVGKAGYYFMPKRRGMKEEAHRRMLMKDNYQAMKIIVDTWIDLRPTFACTVNKAQGSTYDYGFIDLDDICRFARTTNQLARLLYVGVSRFRKGVCFTGDLRR